MRGINNLVVYPIELKALHTGKVSEMFTLHSEVTSAEIYTGNAIETHKLSLKFVGNNEQGFVMYQNEPNPFQDITNIEFNLPEAGEATLTILDVTGKVILERTKSFSKGLQSFQITKGDLNHQGVMIYKIESVQYSATAKMIGLE